MRILEKRQGVKITFKSKKLYLYILTTLVKNTQSDFLLSHSLLAATKLYSAKMEMQELYFTDEIFSMGAELWD